MEENNCNRGAQSRLPLVGPGDQNLIRKETLAAGRFAPGLQAHSSMRKCYRGSLKLRHSGFPESKSSHAVLSGSAALALGAPSDCLREHSQIAGDPIGGIGIV